MSKLLHITSGDCAGDKLLKAGLPGEVFVWHDILYEGIRRPGWPDEKTFHDRASFLEGVTGGGVSFDNALQGLRTQYEKLNGAGEYDLILWFDACLFDQSMLAHLLTCLREKDILQAQLVCVAEFPGIIPFHGLGQLSPEQLASLYDCQQPVSLEQYNFASEAEHGFAAQNQMALRKIAAVTNASLPYLPAAATRWLQELSDPVTGNGRLEDFILQAVKDNAQVPTEILRSVAAKELPPQFWGDTTLWERINRLAERKLLRIDGPVTRLPQWSSPYMIDDFRILPA